MPSRYDMHVKPPAPQPRRPLPTRWRSRDLKGPLPERLVRGLVAVIRNLPQHGPWPQIDEESWWRDVLGDRRLRPSAKMRLASNGDDARLRLDRLPCKTLTFSCQHCHQETTVTVAELMQTFGSDRNVRTIGRQVLKCRNDALWREQACPITYRA